MIRYTFLAVFFALSALPTFATAQTYPPGNIMGYGADPDCANKTATTQALQQAINEVSLENDGESSEVVVPKGHFCLNDNIYLFYDVNENPGHNSNPESYGRITIRGSGGAAGSKSTRGWGQVSHLDFDEGYAFIVADRNLTGPSNAGTVLRGLMISGDISYNTTGYGLVHVNRSPRNHFEDLRIRNMNNDGVALYLQGVWESLYDHIKLSGAAAAYSSSNPTSSRGLFLDTEVDTGGLITFRNVTSAKFKYAFDLGIPRSVGSQQDISAVSMEYCQAQYSDVGIRVRSGIRRLDIITPWFEHNQTAQLMASERAFIRAVNNKIEDQGRLYIRGGSWAFPYPLPASAIGHIVLGGTSGDSELDAVGPVVLDTVQFSTRKGAPNIIRYNDQYNGPLIIRDAAMSSAGSMLQLEDEAQYGTVYVRSTEGAVVRLSNDASKFVTDAAGTKDLSQWVVFEGAAKKHVTLSTTTGILHNYKNAQVMPPLLTTDFANSTDSASILLPNNDRVLAHSFTVYNKGQGKITLRANPASWSSSGTINGATTFDIDGNAKACTVYLDDPDNMEWSAFCMQR
jgi:hypothetical protein